MSLRVGTSPIIPRDRPYPSDVNGIVSRIRSSQIPLSRELADGLAGLQRNVNDVNKALREDPPEITELLVTNSETGRVIAWIGDRVVNGVRYAGGHFIKLYVAGNDPTDALLVADENGLTITDATIVLNGTGAIITLDPVDGSIHVDSATGELTLSDGRLDITGPAGADPHVGLDQTALVFRDASGVQTVSLNGQPSFGLDANASLTSTASVYAGDASSRPLHSLRRARGTKAIPTDLSVSDAVGEFDWWAYRAGGFIQSASIRAVLHDAGVGFANSRILLRAGTNDVLRIFPLGLVGIMKDAVYALDVSGEVNADGYRVGGTAGINDTFDEATGLNVGTASAITSVSGPGVDTTTSGTFVTSVSLNTVPRTFSKGILTS